MISDTVLQIIKKEFPYCSDIRIVRDLGEWGIEYVADIYDENHRLVNKDFDFVVREDLGIVVFIPE